MVAPMKSPRAKATAFKHQISRNRQGQGELFPVMVLRPEAGLTTTGLDEETPDTSTCWAEAVAEPMVLVRLLFYIGAAWTIWTKFSKASTEDVVAAQEQAAAAREQAPEYAAELTAFRADIVAARQEAAAAKEDAAAARKRAEEDRRELAVAMEGIEATLDVWREDTATETKKREEDNERLWTKFSKASTEDVVAAQEQAAAARQKAREYAAELTDFRADIAAARQEAAAAEEDADAARKRAEEDRRELAAAMEGIEATLDVWREDTATETKKREEDNERLVRRLDVLRVLIW
ncbi:expressed unknown protein [Ectocarpus siliculosus]|uniref:Uncharacterized protein n=1 Tax=Ectocarpus siliculosus TaxID=2880 RepID=D7FJ74_ECTSI|nr:expressed unknown protein [Ectocarpus siliculosus]|eukprot:CBJ28984.1 expressed unknown protein [Ectocarpus siliculosus]